MSFEKVRLGVIGSTGAVGQEVLRILQERKIKPAQLHLAASEASAGRSFSYLGESVSTQALTPDFFNTVDMVIASAGSYVSKTFLTPKATVHTVCIDNCSYFRMDKDLSLIHI